MGKKYKIEPVYNDPFISVSILQKLLRMKNYDKIKSLFEEGIKCYEKNDFVKARKFLIDASNLLPGSEEIAYNLAITLLEEHSYNLDEDMMFYVKYLISKIKRYDCEDIIEILKECGEPEKKSRPIIAVGFGDFLNSVLEKPNSHITAKLPVKDIPRVYTQLATLIEDNRKSVSIDTFLSAHCQCGATMNAEYLAFLSTVVYGSSGSAVISSDPGRINTILNGRCPFCGASHWTVVWN